MRAKSRGYIAGVGTTGALVAAAACAFVVVSAIVAFEGWPGARLGLHPATLNGSAAPAGPIVPARYSAELAVSAPDDATGETRGSARHGAAPAEPAGGFGNGRLDGEAQANPGESPASLPAGDHAGAHQATRGSVTGPHGPNGSGTGVSQTPPPASLGDPAPPPPPAGGSGDGTVDETAALVTGTVGTTVTQTGQQLGGTVSGVTGQVGAIVGQVSPALGQTVAQTGQGAGGVVSGATGTVGQVVQGTGQVVGSLLGGLGGHKPSH